MLSRLTQPIVQRYISEHEQDDINQLILKGTSLAGVSVQELATQIYGRIKAKQKLPEWYKTENIVYPAKLSMEQCSSEQTAKYKASILSGDKMIDLTGGAGVDSYYFSKKYRHTTYLEQNPELFEVSIHNFSVLKAIDIDAHCSLAESHLERTNSRYDLIYLDPARRNQEQQRVFRFEDCTPDVTVLLPILLKRGKHIMLKTSPLLDITSALGQLRCVEEIHVIAVNNECKEVLYLLSKDISTTHEITIHTVNLFENKPTQNFSFDRHIQSGLSISYSFPKRYIYEPNVAILKSGGINSVAKKYELDKLHPNSHLFTNEQLVANFPGRTFACLEVLKYDKKVIKKAINKGKANITIRNFPYSVAQIRKHTGLKDGGEDYLFATTNMNNEKIILRTKKLDGPMR